MFPVQFIPVHAILTCLVLKGDFFASFPCLCAEAVDAQSLSFGFVCKTSLLYLVTCIAVFSTSKFAQVNVPVALLHSTSPCVCHGWVVVESF